MKRKLFLLFVISLFVPANSASGGQMSGASEASDFTYSRGASIEESVLPSSPQASSVSRYFSSDIAYCTGSAQISVPIYSLAGRELSVPIGLRYSSGSGIKLDEVAGVAGLGWTLEAGGCVSRTVCDMPDEFSSLDITHSMPSGSLLSELEDKVNNTSTLNYLTSVCRHKVDSRLDRYSYSVCGLSGTFVISEGAAVQLSGDGVLIDLTRDSGGAIESFTITGPDGIRYVFSERETGTHDGTAGNPNVSPLTGAKDLWSATTAWYLTRIESRTGLEVATLSYKPGLQWERTVTVRSQSRSFVTGTTDQPGMSESHSDIVQRYSTKLISGITLNGYEVGFTYSEAKTRNNHTGITQWNYPARLTGVSVKRPDGKTLRSVVVGTERESRDGRVILSTLEFKDSEGSLEDIWRFKYNTLSASVSHTSQDWFGYYNGEQGGYNGICPFSFNPMQTSMSGTPDGSKAGYMTLRECDHDGAVQTFTYEGAMADGTVSVGVRVKSIRIGDGLYRSFSYEGASADGPVSPTLGMYLTVRAPYSSGTITWTFTLHETPVGSGSSIRDTRVYYGKVSESLHTMSIAAKQKTRTVRYFDTSQTVKTSTSVFSRFPLGVKTLYRRYPPYGTDLDPYSATIQDYLEDGPTREPELVSQEDYAYDAEKGSFRKVSETRYEYAQAGAQRKVLVSYEAGQVWYPAGAGNISHANIYHYPVYVTSYAGRNAVKKHIINYYQAESDVSRDSVCVEMGYFERDEALTLPSRLKSSGVTEGKVERRLEYRYPADTSVLYAQHAVSALLQTDYWINHPDAITINPGKPVISTAAIGPLRPVYNPSSKKVKSERTEYGYFTLGETGGRAYLPQSHIEYHEGRECWREDIRARDSKGNIAEYKTTGSPVTSLLWSYGGQYPVIRVENCGIDSIRTYLAERGMQVDSVITAAIFQSKASLLVYRSLLSHFRDAHITTWAYEQGIGLSCLTDAAGTSTEYEYDAAGRLSRVRDNDGNKVEDYEYSLLIGSSAVPAEGTGARSIRTKTYLDSEGNNCAQSVSWWDVLGLHRQDIKLNYAQGADAVFHWGSDILLHDDAYEYLPYRVTDTGGQFQSDAEERSRAYNGSQKPYRARHYESSSRDKVLSEALPGFDGEHETLYEESAASGFAKYSWYYNSVYDRGTYDDGQIIKTVTRDADGRRRAVYRDHFGKTLATSVIRQDQTEDVTYYIYDPYDKLSAVIGSGVGTSAGKKNYWRYAYDTLGRLASKGIPGSSEDVVYAYDSENRVVRQTQGTSVREYEYDAFGRVTRVYFTRGASAPRQLFEEHCYDSYPSCVDSLFELYPSPGECYVGKESYAKIAEIGLEDEVKGYTHRLYTYDAKGRLTERQARYSDGTMLSEDFEYDFRGNVTGAESGFFESSDSTFFVKIPSYCLKENRCYDAENRLTASTERLIKVNGSISKLLSSTYSYDLQGRRVSAVTTIDAPTPFSITADLSYNLQGWLGGIRYKNGTTVLYEESLSYYTNTAAGYPASYAGRITRRQETGLQRSSLMRYDYDYAGRLVGASPYAYAYDSRGNLLAVTNGVSTLAEYTYEGDLLKSVDFGAGAHPFVYDGKGRLTEDYTPSGGAEIKYSDYLGLVSDTKAASYCYLADGSKTSSLKKNESEGEEGLIYRGPFVFKPGEDEWILDGIVCEDGKVTIDGAYIYLKDHLGSVVGVVGAEGQVAEASSYSPYGGRTSLQSVEEAGSPVFREHFTGKEDQKVDFGTDYTDFGARLYSPVIRRWVTPDPKSEDYYGISPYVYCAGDPVNFVDPDGRDWYSYEKPIKNEDGTVRTETQYAWTSATSQEELDKLGIKGTYLDKAVVVFYGSEDERLSKDGFLNKDGAKTATVVVYGPSGANDIEDYIGYTMSSEPKKFGVIANGVYDVYRTDVHGTLDLEWAINNRGKVGSLYGYNPAFPNRRDGYLDNVYVHRSNWNGKANYNSKTGQAVSEGCLLILGEQWNKFSTQLASVQSFKLVLTRKYP